MKIRTDRLDKLFSEYVRRLSSGHCQRCGAYHGWQKLQCCHFIGRSTQSTRWDESNSIAGCFGCHSYLDSHPLEKIEFFKQHLGEAHYDFLLARMRQTHPKPDKKALEIYYKIKIKEMEDKDAD